MHTKPALSRNLPVLLALSVFLISVRSSHSEPANPGNTSARHKQNINLLAEDSFLKLDGIKGESADHKHKDTIHIESSVDHKDTSDKGFIWFDKGGAKSGNTASPDVKIDYKERGDYKETVLQKGVGDYKEKLEVKILQDYKQIGDYKGLSKFTDGKFNGDGFEHKHTPTNGFIWSDKEQSNSAATDLKLERATNPEYKESAEHKHLGDFGGKIIQKTMLEQKNNPGDDKFNGVDDKFTGGVHDHKATGADIKLFGDGSVHKEMGNDIKLFGDGSVHKQSGNDIKLFDGGADHKGSAQGFIWFDKGQANQGNTASPDIKLGPDIKLLGGSKEANDDIPLEKGDAVRRGTGALLEVKGSSIGKDATIFNTGANGVQMNSLVKSAGPGTMPTGAAGVGKIFNPNELKITPNTGPQVGGLTPQVGKNAKTNTTNTFKFNQHQVNQLNIQRSK